MANLYDILDSLDETVGGEGTFPLTQTGFKRHAPPLPIRDRYRVPRDDIYEVADDEGDEMVLDSFDQELLQQPHDDRQRQAARGHARLSLAPKPSMLPDVGAASQPVPDFRAREPGLRQDIARRDHSHLRAQDLSQFVYNATQPQESSSDLQPGASSSPAFKANERRTHSYENPASAPAPHHFSHQDYSHSNAHHVEKRHRVPPPKKVSKPDPITRGYHSTPPVVQGIPLVPVTDLPDRLRSVFSFPIFNAVQSKCFTKVYQSDDNFVLASPTGSGKTAILELAICRAIANRPAGTYKIVYQAPTKALCSERHRDWQQKFKQLNLQCAELTGDSDAADLRNVQGADIIVTTPEKWDSVTRKWKDHEKLMRLIKLFLIDEVHILREVRGASLEAVVSRMKTINTDVRFVALSATVPNFKDVASWLGKNSTLPYEPANNEHFGEEFRPVKLKRYAQGYAFSGSNDFAFDKFLDSKLPEVISRYSEQKPIMIFCCTRKSTVVTAKMLAGWWTQSPRDRYWGAPTKHIAFQDRELGEHTASSVAFHHAGLSTEDRLAVEDGFLKGHIKVICCTSTLAVGVNLPCHLVIIKNTVTFTNDGMQEYSDLDVMQMLGRAGRPQFDNSATAVIMTRSAKVKRYEMMATGQDLLESQLHLNLIEQLNAEIGLGTIHDLDSAKRWLSGTFLYVRIKQNPDHYKLQGSRRGQSVDEQLDDICGRDITLLQDNDLVTQEAQFCCTEAGHAMARYYLHFETMQIILGLKPKTTISEILSALAQAAEFKEVRLRANEKAFYKNLNKSHVIRFQIPVSLNTPAQKISIILQSVLGNADLAWDNDTAKHKNQYTTDATLVFKHAHRLVRCIIDCKVLQGDATGARSALLVERSLCARAWDDSPNQMKQIATIGPAAIRKLVQNNIRSLEELELTEPHRLEVIIGRNPPYGMQLLNRLEGFPKLRVSGHANPDSITKTAEGVKIQLKVDFGFLNESPPAYFNRTAVHVCLLVEASDGRKIHFGRITGQKLTHGQSFALSALVTSPDELLTCYVMCDGIAGTLRWATVNPKIPPSMFSPPKDDGPERPRPNIARRRTPSGGKPTRLSGFDDDFGDDGIDDEDMVKASSGDLDFDHIENYANPIETVTRKNTAKNTAAKPTTICTASLDDDDQEPRQLDNGRWACNHKCKDKSACKHYCCREGLDKPQRKKTVKKVVSNAKSTHSTPKADSEKDGRVQTKLQLTASKRKSTVFVETLDLTQQEKKRKTEYATSGPREMRNLHQLHTSIQGKDVPSSISSVMHKKPAYCYAEGGDYSLSFLDKSGDTELQEKSTSDYGNISLDGFSAHCENSETDWDKTFDKSRKEANDDYLGDGLDEAVPSSGRSEFFADDDSITEDAMIGLADSQSLQADRLLKDDEPPRRLERSVDFDHMADHATVEDEFETERGRRILGNKDFSFLSSGLETAPITRPAASAPKTAQSLFIDDINHSCEEYEGFGPARSMVNDAELKGMQQGNVDTALSRRTSNEKGVAAVRRRKADTHDVDMKNEENRSTASMKDGKTKAAEDEAMDAPDLLKGLEKWLVAEFGDIVEIVDM
ncbi:P-loop containing nucleoside triphosphate hydrolase protein [Polyplosphaeria fusca]|uniref:DNA 3'-5' helicase n=1 Tax=Polyplosphaeria fusca TaxID=682080 RepID=A0A9P4R5I4_9PLEO|nr:P-loop containing nucleoside triphosphate hydrolase protein [Polyplosphaeria fusca]